MIGSTIVYIPNLPSDKSNLIERIIDNDEFEKIELDCLTSLDFAIITEIDNTNWNTKGDPIVYDEQSGIVLCHISKIGLISIIKFTGVLDNVNTEIQKSDIKQIEDFANKYDFENLYELVSF